MALRVYNTLSREKSDFRTVTPKKVGMYVCGPTVYKPSHLGHMVGPVIFDTVKRYLSYCGYEVTFVVNITDVDDKLIAEAAKQNTTVKELAERVTADYCKSLELLNVTGIDHMPRATEHMDAIIEMIQGLIDKGYAYPANGDVYFNVSRDADYGKLCHRDPEQLEAGARIEVSDKKRNAGDFALWKGAKPDEPRWGSPWGPGRPGWHIECSAMSKQLLGKTLDIHGGGLDLQFPHHENELAQSESYNEAQFVRYWMHNGLMRIHSQASKIKGDASEDELQKMSKSLGNEIVVTELFKRHQPETIRFFLLSTHYRRPIDYSEDRLVEIRKGLDGFYRFFELFERITGSNFNAPKAPQKREKFNPGESEFLQEIGQLRSQFLDHMDDDFNTGGAIGVLYEMLTALNRFANNKELESASADQQAKEEFQRATTVLKELTQILGVFEKPQEEDKGQQDELVGQLMQLLIDLRAEARKSKNFALSDQIRDRLSEIGVTLEDRKEGTLWRKG